jgi:short-subunit dehydrogenase
MSLPEPQPNGIALVTGASSGIGEQFVRQLAERGHRVALVARREDRLAKLADELGGPDRAVAIGADLAVPEDRDRLAARLQELGLQVEILVNNAGFGVFSAFAESGRERELRQVRVNVEAVVDLMARYLPGMVERRRGAVINLSSTSAFQALPYNAGYAAAKAHVLLLSEAVREEVKEHGVCVTAVWVSAERVARDALTGADRNRRVVIPGGPHVRASFAPNRVWPAWMTLPVTKRLMARK